MKSIHYLKKTFLVCLATGLFASYVHAQEPTLVWSAEAENFDLAIPANPNDPNNLPRAKYIEGETCYVSGCGFAENISANSSIQFNNIEVPEEGTYELHMYYMLSEPAGRGIGVTPNYQFRDTIWVMEQTGSWDGSPQYDTTDPDNPVPIPDTGGTKVATKLIYLQQGSNMIKIGGSGVGYTPNFDKFEIYTTTATIDKPANVPCSWEWDYTDEAASVTLNGVADDNVKKVYDNIDDTYLELPGNSYVDFTFANEMRFTGFLIFTGDRANLIQNDDFEIQARENESSAWVNASKAATDARGQGQVYQSNIGDGRFSQFRLQLKKEASQTVRISEIQFFGYPDVNITDPNIPDFPITYPEDLIRVEVQNYRTENEISFGTNGNYTYSSNGLINVTNKWFECASRAVDGRRNSKWTILGTKNFWLQFDFDEPVAAKSYSLAMCAQNTTNRNPANWVLKASEDWGETWVDIATVNGFVYPKCNYNNIKFPVDKAFWSSEFSSFRIEMQNAGGSDSNLSQFQLLADPIYVPDYSTGVKNTVKLEQVAAFARKGAIVLNSATSEQLSYHIFNMTGAVVKSGVFTSNTEIALAQGIYLVRIQSKDGLSHNSKVLIP